MKNCTLLLLSLLILMSCERFDDQIPEGSSLEVPILISDIVSPTEVLLTWSSDQVCAGFCPSLAPASYYEIWAKSLNSSIDYKIGEVPAGASTYSVAGLESGVVQEFFVVAKRANVRNETNRVMVVPNELPTVKTILKKEGFDYITHPQVSPDGTEVVYTVSKAGVSGSAQDVFMYNLKGKTERLVQENGQYPSWSASGEKLVFISEATHASVINEFTLASGATKARMGNSYKSYFPRYVEDDGSLVYFLDSLQAGESGFFSLGLSEPDTIFLVDLTPDGNAPVPLLGMDFSAASNRIVYSSAYPTKAPTGFSYDIIGFTLDNAETAVELEVSGWNDTNPSFAPGDSDLLAFVSDRSGIQQLWIKNLLSQELIQVTDFHGSEWINIGIVSVSWTEETLFFNITDVKGTSTLVSVDVASLL